MKVLVRHPRGRKVLEKAAKISVATASSLDLDESLRGMFSFMELTLPQRWLGMLLWPSKRFTKLEHVISECQLRLKIKGSKIPKDLLLLFQIYVQTVANGLNLGIEIKQLASIFLFALAFLRMFAKSKCNLISLHHRLSFPLYFQIKFLITGAHWVTEVRSWTCKQQPKC